MDHSQEFLLDRFYYNSVTGKIFNRKNFSRRARIDQEAGTTNNCGYRIVNIFGKLHLTHRIVWVMINNQIPDGMQIDHINGDRLDNRICNLRAVTSYQNRINSSVRKDSLIGVKGVQFHKQTGKWLARISFAGKKYSLGLHDSVDDAAKAYQSAAIKFHGEFARVSL